ncbi:tensin-4 [Teleopsis dalmanni]|uniref:tensin-4 n=1 Tax=Teleopsis dalmanni TaxID=139649 RepID=UPI0018CFA817|nr:tensin-4 [Teleopsis dalmanni]
MRSPYESFSTVSDSEETKNSAIPYHARENSLPFSYGQINKTSTQLRSVGSGTTASALYRNGGTDDSGIDFGLTKDRSGFNLYSDSDYLSKYNNNGPRNASLGHSSSINSRKTETDGKMIKTQPRLTSPLLVRKSLNSRSPTRGSTNTIANTYHYNYDTTDNSSSGLNGNSNKYNSISSSNTLRKTPTRNDFEELLRQRREKIYNEYQHRSTMPDLRNAKPEPPQRQYLTTTTASRPTNGQNKYNFDFEFNLNLDDAPSPQRRANTIDRSWSQYRTRDIPVAPETAYSERNYNTIGSTNAVRETTSSKSSAVGFASQERERPLLPMNHNNNRSLSEQHIQRTEYTTYGNGNLSGYSSNNNKSHINNDFSYDGTLGGTRSRSDLSPIYATTTRQVTGNNNNSMQNNKNSVNSTTTITTTTYRNAYEPELSITDYPLTAKASTSTQTVQQVGVSRPETPAFPVTPRTPFGNYNTASTQPHSPNGGQSTATEIHNYSAETIYQTNPTAYRPRLNSSVSMINSEPQEVAAHLVKFAKDSSKFWYKPNLSREEAISLLINAVPGTFIVRDSTTYKNAYGLVLRVSQPPPGVTNSGKPDELVRHFLIEPTTRGVRLKGCANEPVFTSLSALVYEHSINQLALPCLLRIPEDDLVPSLELTPAQKHLFTQGAATNVLWLYSCETESLTGEEAIRKAIRQLYAQKSLPSPTVVHFKVSQQGITLTDNTRKKFFRKHYAADIISYCAIDPDHRVWTMQEEQNGEEQKKTVGNLKKTIFAFVARRSSSSKDNQCHVFCDLSITQPASAIVSFANKTLPTEKQRNYVL